MDKNCLLKVSKYAFFIDKPNGEILIYSPLSGAIIKVFDESKINEVNRIRNASCIEYEDNEVISALCKNKILLEEGECEDEVVEYIYAKNILQSRTLELTLIVTRQCNFRCVYCGQAHENKHMEEDTYSSIIDHIRSVMLNKYYNSVIISFFGGEPLLEYNNIVAFLEKLKDLSEELGFSYTAGMTTNGYLLTKHRFEKLVYLGCSDYQITIDGTQNTHDKTRILENGLGTWDVIFNNLVYAVSTTYDFSITLRTNYNLDILNEIEEFYSLIAKELKDDRIEIYYESIKDHGNVHTPELMSGIEEIIGNTELAAFLKKYGLKASKTNIRPGGMVCRAALPNFFAIDYNADVIKCTHLLDWPDNKIGYLDKNGCMMIKTDLERKWSYFSIRKNKDCAECELLPLCFGKRCPIDVVADCFVCNAKLNELNLTESLERTYLS